MGVQSPSTLATEAIVIVRKEGLSIPVRALNTSFGVKEATAYFGNTNFA